MGAEERGDGESAASGLVRAEVATRLGLSISGVRRLEWDRLHPKADNRGVWRFDPAEVDAVAATMPPRAGRAIPLANRKERAAARKGRLAARVFRMFARRMGLPQIVVATKQPPEVIRKLYTEWSTSLDMAEWERRNALERD
jgi:hypothetical protein